jgi:NADPH:quinone reductase
LAERDVPEPGVSDVVVAVEASPINRSDLGVLLGAVAPGTLRPDGPDLVGAVPEAALPLYRDRLDKPLPVGNEGAGTVIAAGPEAAALIGRLVALFGGSMLADYRIAHASAIVELPDDASTAEGAALFINPLTALSMVETMRAEGHSALVHTAAASNLGQMLVRICAADGLGLVNIVRRAAAEHAQVLRDLPLPAQRDCPGSPTEWGVTPANRSRAAPDGVTLRPRGTQAPTPVRAPSCLHDCIRHSR